MKKMNTASAEAPWQEWVSTPDAARDLSIPAQAPTVSNGDPHAVHDAICRRAYSYWEARGRQGGCPEEDWLRAEAEIRKGAGLPETDLG